MDGLECARGGRLGARGNVRAFRERNHVDQKNSKTSAREMKTPEIIRFPRVSRGGDGGI